MRGPDEIARAARHFDSARRGSEQAALLGRVIKPGDDRTTAQIEAALKKADEDDIKAAVSSRVVDALHWVLGAENQFAHQIKLMDEFDRTREVLKLRGA